MEAHLERQRLRPEQPAANVLCGLAGAVRALQAARAITLLSVLVPLLVAAPAAAVLPALRVALEPSMPGITPFVASVPALDLLNGLNATPASLTDDFLARGGGLSPLEFLQSRAQDYLSANRPELNYAQLLRTVAHRSESLRLIPGSLPYRVESVLDESPFLREQFKHRLARPASG
jgi:hypothetical protein